MGSEGRLLRRRCLINLRVKEASKEGREDGGKEGGYRFLEGERRPSLWRGALGKVYFSFCIGTQTRLRSRRHCFDSVIGNPDLCAAVECRVVKDLVSPRSRKWDGDGLQRFNPLSRSRSQLLQYREPLRDRERASQ